MPPVLTHFLGLKYHLCFFNRWSCETGLSTCVTHFCWWSVVRRHTEVKFWMRCLLMSFQHQAAVPLQSMQPPLTPPVSMLSGTMFPLKNKMETFLAIRWEIIFLCRCGCTILYYFKSISQTMMDEDTVESAQRPPASAHCLKRPLMLLQKEAT